MFELPPIKYKREYETAIANKITVWLWANIFQECFNILKSDTIYNDENIIREAIEQGKIYYQDGGFYSTTGRFPNTISKELEKLGAKYSKYRKAYLLDKSQVPNNIIWAIDTSKVRTAGKVLAIQAFLNYQLNELSKKEKQLVFDELVNKIMLNLQERVYKNAKAKKIELITPKLDEFRANEIAQRYTNNLNYWIQGWLPQDIIKMREVVGQMAIEGKSSKAIADYIIQRFGIEQRHAQFLARNESAIATTSYLQAKYKEEGFTHFLWHTNYDGRERELHAELGKKQNNKYGINGTNLFRFDNPPIIDERTGQRGLPAETYNCRCTFSPVANEEWLENRKKLYKAQNSLINKIKGFIHA